MIIKAYIECLNVFNNSSSSSRTDLSAHFQQPIARTDLPAHFQQSIASQLLFHSFNNIQRKREDRRGWSRSLGATIGTTASALLHAQLYRVDSLSTDHYCKRCVLGNNIFCPSHISTLDNFWNYSINQCKKKRKVIENFLRFVLNRTVVAIHFNMIELKNVPINY